MEIHLMQPQMIFGLGLAVIIHTKNMKIQL